MRRTLLLLIPFVVAQPATAGWVSIKNDTKEPVLVQEHVSVNGTVRKSKPLKLMPGETLREFLAGPCTKSLHIAEPGLLLNKALCQSDLQCAGSDQCFSVCKDGDKVKLLTAEQAKALTAVVRAQLPTAKK